MNTLLKILSFDPLDTELVLQCCSLSYSSISLIKFRFTLCTKVWLYRVQSLQPHWITEIYPNIFNFFQMEDNPGGKYWDISQLSSVVAKFTLYNQTLVHSVCTPELYDIWRCFFCEKHQIILGSYAGS